METETRTEVKTDTPVPRSTTFSSAVDTFLITSGAMNFVARTGNFLPIVAGMLDRRVRMAERAAG